MQIHIRVEGDKIILENLQGLINNYPKAIQRGLSRSVKGIHRLAVDFLGAEGAKGEYSSGRWKRRDTQIPSGGYPVPVRTGTLRRMLWFTEPREIGRNKFDERDSTHQAGPMEAIVYNSAEYARVIHAGTGSSAKFGPRQYLTDALDRFNQGNRIAEIISEEIEEEIKKHGL